MALSGSTRGAGAAPTSPPAGERRLGQRHPVLVVLQQPLASAPSPPGWRRAGDCPPSVTSFL